MNNNWQEYIYTQLKTESYLWARQCCSYNGEHAKEVMQMAYLKLLEEKATYNGKANLKTWFFAVIRFTAIDFLKQLPNHLSIEDVELNVADNSEVHYDNYLEILNQLPDRQHQVLLLVFYHNLRLHEVAEVLNIGIGSVRTHYDRGKKKLKALLTKEMTL